MGQAETILIVDDEPVLRTALRVLLETWGYQVREAVDGLAGLLACAGEPPDLVLLDALLPGMDGFEVCTRLQADPGLRGIPVIFLTGLMDSEHKVKALRCGAVDHISKPFHPEEVEARVQVHLELRRQRQRLEAQTKTLQQALGETERLNRELIAMNERLRHSEALKGHFLSNVRNEINNPLNAILGLGLELEAGKVPAERISSVGGILAAEAAELDFQLRNIFLAAELEAGEATPFPSRVDVAALVQEVVENLRSGTFGHGIRFRLEVGGAGPFITDARMVKIILTNLTSNAVKFGPPAGEIRISASQEGQALRLEVADQGMGIAAGDQQRIFERFRQLDQGPTRRHGGQGLGLSVVKALVELLEGRLEVESQPGSGSRFACVLPPLDASGERLAGRLEGDVLFYGDMEEV